MSRQRVTGGMPTAAAVDLAVVIEGDRRFFDRHTGREHRIRHLSLAEAADFAAQGRALPKQEPGWRWFVAVKRLPIGRVRAPFGSPEDAEVDLPEELARCLFLAVMDQQRTGLPYGVVPAEALR